MLAEDYFQAVGFRTNIVPPPLDRWSDEAKLRAGIASFKGIG